MGWNTEGQSQAPFCAAPAAHAQGHARYPARAKRFIACNAPFFVRAIIKSAYALGVRPKAQIIAENERVWVPYVDLKDWGEVPDERSRIVAFWQRLRRYWLLEGVKEHAWANPHLTPPSFLAKGF